MNQENMKPSAAASDTGASQPTFAVRGLRYQCRDVKRAIAFYTQHLHFKLDFEKAPAFALVSIGTLAILMSGPGSSGARPMPDGRQQEPGG